MISRMIVSTLAFAMLIAVAAVVFGGGSGWSGGGSSWSGGNSSWFGGGGESDEGDND